MGWLRIRQADAQPDSHSLRQVKPLSGKLRLVDAQVRYLMECLWDCLVASGVDVSGYGGPERWMRMGVRRGAEEAVEGVRRLRADYDVDFGEVTERYLDRIRNSDAGQYS